MQRTLYLAALPMLHARPPGGVMYLGGERLAFSPPGFASKQQSWPNPSPSAAEQAAASWQLQGSEEPCEGRKVKTIKKANPSQLVEDL